MEVLRTGEGWTEGQVMKSFCEQATGHPITWRMSVVGSQSRETMYMLLVDTEGWKLISGEVQSKKGKGDSLSVYGSPKVIDRACEVWKR